MRYPFNHSCNCTFFCRYAAISSMDSLVLLLYLPIFEKTFDTCWKQEKKSKKLGLILQNIVLRPPLHIAVLLLQILNIEFKELYSL